MNSILEIPEIKALDGPAGLIRIPNQIDVPATDRILRLIDTPEFQRLAHISQLGLVSVVYPAATHNRFEHSLGVYRMSLLFLRHLAYRPEFVERVSAHQAATLIIAALLHDIGHWPFCHPIEDLKLAGIPEHESFGSRYIGGDNISKCLAEGWGIDSSEVMSLIHRKHDTVAGNILGSILSGPIDIDKMDYLYRDSLHAGVPYGQNFDSPRLIRSLCLNQAQDRLAITHKGKTAAELMVFARYVMFSEVYWHHAVRSATAMFQRAFYLWHQRHHQARDFSQTIDNMFQLRENDLIQSLMKDDPSSQVSKLLNALFGQRRALFKRIVSYNIVDGESIYREIAQRPYEWIVDCSRHLAELISKQIGKTVDREQVLIDAPPVGLEVQFNVEVYFGQQSGYRDLGTVSPVVQTLAHRQFDDFVKQVRIFVDPVVLPEMGTVNLPDLLKEAICLANRRT